VIRIICGNAIEAISEIESESVNCCVTSPPYFGLRDYGIDGQIGLEETIDEFITKMVEVFREVRRVLRDDGTLWINLGDSYSAGGNQGHQSGGEIFHGHNGNRGITGFKRTPGFQPKNLLGIPWRVAFALQADGWYLRQDIIWHKPNPMPESIKDRCTKAHEYIFLLSKSARYYYDAEAIKEDCVQNEMANGFRGGSYCHDETADNETGGKRKTPGNQKIPAGWDMEKRAHGSFHKDGRGKTRYGGKKYTENTVAFNRTKSGNLYEPKALRNKRSVWTVATKPYKEAHFATYPPALITPCILAGCPEGGTVLDPFVGSGTTLEVAARYGRSGIGIEINPEYIKLIEKRCHPWIYGQDLFEGCE
jgi:site-specific DNA-methyltransferase (adenine-specific)